MEHVMSNIGTKIANFIVSLNTSLHLELSCASLHTVCKREKVLSSSKKVKSLKTWNVLTFVVFVKVNQIETLLNVLSVYYFVPSNVIVVQCAVCSVCSVLQCVVVSWSTTGLVGLPALRFLMSELGPLQTGDRCNVMLRSPSPSPPLPSHHLTTT